MMQPASDHRIPLVVLTGPTAVGKTELSISLAKALDGEIISADSVQVYKFMDIGSAKIRPEEMEGIPHYLIDERMPEDAFHIAAFVEEAKKHMGRIHRRGHIPLVVGGTGFYIHGLLYDVQFQAEDGDTSYREKLAAEARQYGPSWLHKKLTEVDPQSGFLIHENNVKRVIRALEFYHQYGYPISAHNAEQRERRSPYRFAYFVLNRPRQELYARIDARVDEMIQAGLVEEVQRLREMGCHRDMTAMQGLGYKQIFSHLEGETSLADAVAAIKQETRHFAKRQLTWFRREADVIWVNYDDFAYDKKSMLTYMLDLLKEKGILHEKRRDASDI